MNCSCGTECASASDLADHKLHCMHGEEPQGGEPAQAPSNPAQPSAGVAAREGAEIPKVEPVETPIKPAEEPPKPKQEVAPISNWCGECPKSESAHMAGSCVNKTEPVKESGEIDFTLYKQLPPPIVKYLEETWGNWLNHFPISRREWSKDYDDYGIVVEVPERFSVEWHREKRQVYDNNTRRPKVDENGRPVTVMVVTKDVRLISLKVGTDKAKGWLDKVKNHIINKAFQKGIKLPNTQTEYQSDISRDEYIRKLHKA